MEICLRSATTNDLDFLHFLRDQTMRSYLEQAGMSVSYDSYQARIKLEFQSAQIVEVDNQSAGLFKAVYQHENNHWEIIQIQILPAFQGLGIGSKLITGLIDTAAKSEAKVGLSVIGSNPAKVLYERLGFQVIGREGSEYLMELKT
ncbi:GNAT family N-acetyltransferase [Vibrio sp. B511a]|nr:N-acetyltransferase [Vibrio sp. B511a]EGQ8020132.1 GNAT family N-acetyltransferase [Vibrio alginolyticus]EGR0804920.1 N-acetyltransferase [Vibrio alginolyticus]EJL6722055.1 GNAT family N-acetyltransferase [Vibrio alginolyticus]MDK9735498.1 GNAT family N-acetyltransferase [Vibrio sp. B511a]